MKIVYSPYYDGNCFVGNPDKAQCQLGTKYVGDIGLLNEMELRAGLSRGDVSPMSRAIAYCRAIQDALDSKPATTPFYRQSFENDPLGVARQLLAWRDALTMAGWNAQTSLPTKLSTDGKARLADLQAIEPHFHSIGVGERWQALLAAAKGRPVLPKGTSVTVEMKWDLLHPVIRKVFEAINKKQSGTVCESDMVSKMEEQTLDSGKFELYEFPEQNDAYQWAVSQNFENAVFVNEDNFTFNQVLKSLGKPLVDATAEGGAAELSQLLKLGISLFRNPVNITHLIAYLSIFRHPMEWDTRRELRKHLQGAGGFGKNMGKDFPVVDKKYENLWGMWDKCKKGKVMVDDVKSFCQALLDWIKTTVTKANVEKAMNPMAGTQICSQLSILQAQIQHLTLFLEGKTDISNDELEKITISIAQGDAVTTDYARLGSYDMLKNLKGLACSGQTVVWLDCVGKPRPHYPYAFLNPKDIEELRNSGLDIPQPELEMQASDFAEKLAVQRAVKIIVLMPKRKDGERTEENLLITELKTLNMGLLIASSVLPIGESVNYVDADSQKVEHQVDKSLFANITTPNPESTENKKKDDPSKFVPKPAGYQRDYESYSSLSELINQPFDYVFDYLYNMKDAEEGNLSQTEGNVAHTVISQMVDESKDAAGVVNTTDFLNLCKDKNLEQRVDKAILDVGAVLLQPENTMECNTFKRIFMEKSIPTLVEIIEDNGLEVVDSEKENTVDLCMVFTFNAKIDFILKKKNEETLEEEYFIFDFKWTGSPTKRIKELEDRKELQLALYQKVLETAKCKVVMRGYYLLKQATLLTTYSEFLPNDHIEIIKQSSTADIFKQAVESYRERIQNLQDGFIEEGEGMKGHVFIGTKFIDEYLNDANALYINNKLKKNSRGPGLTAQEKASTYGKNAVLKGKIK